MTKYKVGDVAALFSKPKNPTTTAGKKLQSLFEDYYSKKSNSVSSQNEGNPEINKNEEKADLGASKKNRKRKFSPLNDSELNENASSKKLKESELAESFKTGRTEKTKNKKKLDFPRKNKKPNINSFNTSKTFPKFEAQNDSENDESPSISVVKNLPKDIEQNSVFIKKSKKKFNNKELSNDISSKNDDDATLRKEITELMYKNSKESEENKNFKQKKTFKWDRQDATKKSKKNSFKEVSSPLKHQQSFEENNNIKQKKSKWDKQNTTKKSPKNLLNEADSPKYEKSFEKNVKTEKMVKNDQQDFPRRKKDSKSKFNFSHTESEIKVDTEQNSSANLFSSANQDGIKKPKKSKRKLSGMNTDNLTHENDSVSNIPKGLKMCDFSKSFKHFVENSNSEISDDEDTTKKFKKNKQNVNSVIQNTQKGEFVAEELDFIKLPSINDERMGEENKEEYEKERLSRTLFVGNLPIHTTRRQVKKFFSVFGPVETIRLTGIETDKAKIFGQNPSKKLHSNYASDTIPAFVVFKERRDAVKALKSSGSMFYDRHITVDFALPAGTHKLYDNKRSIFIGNLPFNVQDESIWNAFAQCGRIECVRVVRDRETGIGKGFGYVLFCTVESKENALALEELIIDGRTIRIKAVDSDKKVQKSDSSVSGKDTFKSHAIRLKKNSNISSSRKSIKKLANKQKMLHKKKKIASILQKAMK